MRGSIALINPSEFGGWSTTVEEAKAYGVPMLLSDLDVHREQASTAQFFSVSDDLRLADLLEAAWLGDGPADRVDQERRFEQEQEVRVQQFAGGVCGRPESHGRILLTYAMSVSWKPSPIQLPR
jgi:hypothetical protein